MKKIFTFLVVAFILVSCNDDEILSSIKVQDVDTEATEMFGKRSLEEAIEIARNSYTSFRDDKTRSSVVDVDLGNISYVVDSAKTRSAVDDTLMYIINFAGDNGFAVVSADKATEGLIALIEHGVYKEASTKTNEAFNEFMGLATNYIKTFKVELLPGWREGTVPLMEIKSERDTTTRGVGPLLEVEWGQGSKYYNPNVYGAYAPNGIAGCVNTAMAQIMTYFAYPQAINISYSDATINKQTLDWDKMIKHKNIRQQCNTEEEDHEAISQLMRQLGEMNNSDYSDGNSTGTKQSSTISTFTELGYNASKYVDYDSENFYSTLSEGKLLLFTGFMSNSTSSTQSSGSMVGHAWVVDGSLIHSTHLTTWTRTIGTMEWTILDESYTNLQYLHINWGWDGDSNGYFSAGVFATANAKEYDSSYHSADYTFDYNIQYSIISL